ncbi:MAG: hypothetical protein ACRDWG_06980 [Actinomycetes bacterium]|nr:hypothetical protein [Actinomycetes bacterium]
MTTTSRPSPLQNRVTPTGEIVAHPARGMFMGNRGCLHDPDGRLRTARWRSKLWICCTLNWKDVRRDPMPPGRWTALFFMDEAVALAAGHRPCAYCRYQDYVAFRTAWQRALGLTERPRAQEMDARLHGERVESRTRRQRTRSATAGELPDRVMIKHAGAPGLLLGRRFLPWSFAGYADSVALRPASTVELLTPPSTVATIAAGYRPVLHPSADRVRPS